MKGGLCFESTQASVIVLQKGARRAKKSVSVWHLLSPVSNTHLEFYIESGVYGMVF